MSIAEVARNLKLFERNREWILSPLPAGAKFAYYPGILLGYLTLLASRRKSVGYLGKPFEYDNPATPLNLQNYPYEVGVKILCRMKSKPKSALDVGANIGQFSRTLGYLAPHCEIDSIEPNPAIFDTLEKNATRNMRVFRCALGPSKGTATFYYEPNRSGIGSFLKANAGNQDRIKEVSVEVEDDVARVTGQREYDLVKVDVEGFEFDALKALKNVKAKYLYIEVSGDGREKHFTDAQLYKLILESMGDYNLLYASGVSDSNATYELLLEFV